MSIVRWSFFNKNRNEYIINRLNIESLREPNVNFLSGQKYEDTIVLVVSAASNKSNCFWIL